MFLRGVGGVGTKIGTFVNFFNLRHAVLVVNQLGEIQFHIHTDSRIK